MGKDEPPIMSDTGLGGWSARQGKQEKDRKEVNHTATALQRLVVLLTRQVENVGVGMAKTTNKHTRNESELT